MKKTFVKSIFSLLVVSLLAVGTVSAKSAKKRAKNESNTESPKEMPKKFNDDRIIGEVASVSKDGFTYKDADGNEFSVKVDPFTNIAKEAERPEMPKPEANANGEKPAEPPANAENAKSEKPNRKNAKDAKNSENGDVPPEPRSQNQNGKNFEPPRPPVEKATLEDLQTGDWVSVKIREGNTETKVASEVFIKKATK